MTGELRTWRPGGSRTTGPGGHPWPVALLLGSASLLVLFDSLAVATALPSIGVDFGLDPGGLQWVVSLYSLSIGALLVLGGRVCDLWGRRRTLVASLVLCTVAGVIAGLAPGLPLLLVGRVLQGVAAAFAIPAALATAGTVFTEEPWKSRVFAVIAFAAWAAGLAGAMLGGLITVHLGWRWIFLVTVPVGVVAVGAALVFLDRDAPRRGVAGKLDMLGAVVVSAGLVTLLLGMEQLGHAGHVGRAVFVVCLGLILLACLVLVERRASHPLITPRLVRSRRMVGSCLAFGAYCAGYTAVIVVGSLRLQEEHGLSAAGAGLALSPVLVSGIISSLLSPMIVRRHGTRVVLIVSMLLCASALAMIAISGSSGVAALLPWLVLWGISSGPIYVTLTRECVGDAEEADRGTASALLESMSHVGGGVAASGYLILLGAGAGFRPTELVGAFAVAIGALIALGVLPRRSSSR